MKKILKSLWVPHYEIMSRGRIQYKKLTPLLQIRQFASFKFIPHVTKNKKYQYQNVFAIYSSNLSNCRRSKTINKVREVVRNIIDERTTKGKLYDIYLNQIVLFLPESQIQKHLRKALISNAKQSSLTTNKLLIIKDYQNYSKSYQKLLQQINPNLNKFSMIDVQSSNINIIFNNYYILQFHSDQNQKLKILRDFILLKLTLQKFDFFKFFLNYQGGNVYMGYKLGERFLKSIRFQSDVTLKYLLMVIRWRNYQKLMYTIRSMMEIYDNQYKDTMEKRVKRSVQ